MSFPVVLDNPVVLNSEEQYRLRPAGRRSAGFEGSKKDRLAPSTGWGRTRARSACDRRRHDRAAGDQDRGNDLHRV